MGMLPWSIGVLLQVRVSYKRINRFLGENEIDFNIIDQGDYNSVEKNNVVISINGLKFSWPKRKEKSKTVVALSKNKIAIEENEENDIKQKLIDENQENDLSLQERTAQFELNPGKLEFRKGELYYIIGKVGSGKSALLNAILNEMDARPVLGNSQMLNSSAKLNLDISKNACIKIKGSIGYVSQNSWLQDKTIRVNERMRKRDFFLKYVLEYIFF